jgi:hypothetical protein
MRPEGAAQRPHHYASLLFSDCPQTIREELSVELEAVSLHYLQIGEGFFERLPLGMVVRASFQIHAPGQDSGLGNFHELEKRKRIGFR